MPVKVLIDTVHYRSALGMRFKRESDTSRTACNA